MLISKHGSLYQLSKRCSPIYWAKGSILRTSSLRWIEFLMVSDITLAKFTIRPDIKGQQMIDKEVLFPLHRVVNDHTTELSPNQHDTPDEPKPTAAFHVLSDWMRDRIELDT